MKFVLLSFFAAFSALAADVQIKDYNWSMTDIASKGLTKETLFSKMDRDFIKLGKSICSNRALLWANDFKRDYNLDSGKVFLFFTTKKEEPSLRKEWWYHVAPVINENGNIVVMDAGFPGFIKTPLTVGQWLEKFAYTANCKEISASDTDLVEYIYNQAVFPKQTAYGYNTCYYKIVPHTLWTPEVVAKNLLGKDSQGRPVRVERHEINKDELMQACLEATTGKIGWALGNGKKKCEEYVAR